MLSIEKIEKNKKAYRSLLLLADPYEPMLDRYLSDGEMYVLVQDGEPVCEAVVTTAEQGCCELKNLATVPEKQGQGFASFLVRWLLDRYCSSFAGMLVGTSDSNVPFYESLGFSYSHTIPNFFPDHYPQPLWDGGRLCVDMLYLKYNFSVSDDK